MPFTPPPDSPNFKPGVGRITLDRYDFEAHLEGVNPPLANAPLQNFRHNATQTDLLPDLTINTISCTTVQQAIEALSGALVPPTITLATTSSPGIIQLGGDLSGNNNAHAPKVSGLQGFPVSTANPAVNQVLTWNGSTWIPAPPTSSSITLGGDVTGASGFNTVIKLRNAPLPAPSGTNTVLTWNGSSLNWSLASGAPSGPAGGDLSGTYPNPTVATASGHAIITNVTTAGGDLSSTYPNPTVAKIQNNTVTSGALTKGQFFVATTTSNWAATTLSGDVTESNTTAGQLTVIKVDGVSYPASPATNTVPVVTASNTVTYQQIANAQVSNTAAIAVSKLASGTAAQVLLNNATPTPTWTTISQDATISATGLVTVTGLQTHTVPTPTGTNTLLTWSGSSFSWTTNAASVTWAGDLAGSTNSAQYVGTLTGPSGAGGAITMAANTYINKTVGVGSDILRLGGASVINYDGASNINFNAPGGTMSFFSNGTGVISVEPAGQVALQPTAYISQGASGSFLKTTGNVPVLSLDASFNTVLNSSGPNMQFQVGSSEVVRIDDLGNVFFTYQGVPGAGLKGNGIPLPLGATNPAIDATGPITITLSTTQYECTHIILTGEAFSTVIVFPNLRGVWYLDTTQLTNTDPGPDITIQSGTGPLSSISLGPNSPKAVYIVYATGSNFIAWAAMTNP